MTDRLEPLRALADGLRDRFFWRQSPDEYGKHRDVDHEHIEYVLNAVDEIRAFLAAEDARQPASAAQGAQEPVPFAWEYTERSTTTDGAPTGVVTLTHQPPDRVSDLHRYTYRPLYASPPAPVVTDEMVEQALDAWYGFRGHGPETVEPAMRAALEAALGAKP